LGDLIFETKERSKQEVSLRKLGEINISSISGKFAIEFVFVRTENSEEIVGKQIFEELSLNDVRRHSSSKLFSPKETALLEASINTRVIGGFSGSRQENDGETEII
jgi:hypothetical protein